MPYDGDSRTDLIIKRQGLEFPAVAYEETCAKYKLESGNQTNKVM